MSSLSVTGPKRKYLINNIRILVNVFQPIFIIFNPGNPGTMANSKHTDEMLHKHFGLAAIENAHSNRRTRIKNR